jgi:hypothetical protein
MKFVLSQISITCFLSVAYFKQICTVVTYIIFQRGKSARYPNWGWNENFGFRIFAKISRTFFSFFAKKLKKFSFSRKFSRKFSIGNADPDLEATWLCIQIRNNSGKFSRKLKFFVKSFTKTETFRGNHPGNKNFSRKLSWKRKFSRKLSRKSSQKLSWKQKFPRKLSRTRKF